MTSKLNAAFREHAKQRRIGPDARCTSCGEDDIRALQQTVVCAECRLKIQGRSIVERHHPAGKANRAETVNQLANDHAILSEHQREWPVGMLRNPERDPLRSLAALLSGLRDTCRLVIERLDVMIDWIEWLANELRKRLGAGWWMFPQYTSLEGAL